MSSVGRTMGGLLARPQRESDTYALCENDGFWFRPAYTEGKCPLCGEPAPGGAPDLPFLLRSDRSWLGVSFLALESLVMLTLVLLMYFKG